MRYKIIIILLIVVVTGCASNKKNTVVESAPSIPAEVQKAIGPVTVLTAKDYNRPDWTSITAAEDGGKMYFVGGFLNGADYAFSIRCANAEAMKVACQSISQFIRAEFSSYVQGSNRSGENMDRYISDGISTFTNNIHVQGMKQSELYWEEIFRNHTHNPYYNIWVRIEMATSDYMYAKTEAVKALRDKFKDEGQIEAKEKADRILRELKEETL